MEVISIKCSVKIVFISLILFISIGCAFAHENTTDLNETSLKDSFNLPNDCELADNPILSSSNSSECLTSSAEPDTPDQIINITRDNVGQYFRRGVLRDTYNYATFNIADDLEDLNILIVRASNVTINGNNHILTNTVFSIEADGVTLNNLTLKENRAFDDNEYAAVLIWRSNDVNLYNLNIDYAAPNATDAFGIYSLGYYNYYSNKNYRNYNLEIVNCSVNIKGDNRAKGRVYGVKLEESPYARVINSTISSEVSMRSVDFTGTTAVLDSEFSLAVGVDHCDSLVFDSNTVNCSANARPECAYPTLDAIFICDSNDCNFTNNRVYLNDYLTFKDIPNYLYALDVYRDNNLLVENNSIRVETTGGAFAAGTAYPLQLTGPAHGIIIQFNDIYSKSNGPNIGIYSQNFNGDNYVTVLNNYINVTGLAGNHSWALVAGIEMQDNNDIIMNNIIEIHNIQKVELEDNIYGISYSQKTDSRHTYRVVNNTVISDGYYVSYMLDADNTTVTNNTLVRTDKYADTNYDPFKRGDGIGADTDKDRNNDFSGNRVITIFEYDLEHQSNVLDGGDILDYEPPENVDNLTNIINGSGIAPLKPGFPGGNPLLPGHNGDGSFNTGGDNNGGLSPEGADGNGFKNPDAPDGDNGYKGWPDLSGDDGKSLSRKNHGGSSDAVDSYTNEESSTNSYNNHGSSSNSFNNLEALANSTSSETPSVDGQTSAGISSPSSSSAGSGGEAGSSGASQNMKAYEITKNIVESSPDDIIKFIALAIVCEILLIIGYRRKETEDITD